MATATITRAVQSGSHAIVEATMAADQPDAGAVYTVQVPLEELRAASTTTARTALIVAALTADRNRQLERQTKIDAFLANALGRTAEI